MKKVLAGLLLVASVSFAVAVLTKPNAPPPSGAGKVRVAVSRTPLSAPIYLAQELGYFSEAGLAVELVEVIGGHNSFQLMMDGKAEYGVCTDSVIMFRAMRGAEFSALATFVQSGNDVKLISRASDGPHSVGELAQRRVGVIKGSASEYFAHTLLAFEGVDPREVRFVPYEANELPQALRAGSVDAVSVWEPYAYETVQLLKEDAHVFETRNIYNLTFNLVARNAHVAASSDQATRMLAALERAVDYINQNPRPARDRLRARLGLAPDFVEWIWDDYLFKLALNRSLLLTLESQARWAIRSGLVDVSSAPEFHDFLDSAPLARVNPAALSL